MILKSITIINYRSIEELNLELEHLDDSTLTYGLIGVNEVGKSSILKAIAVKDGLIPLVKKDFRDGNGEIKISLRYSLTPSEEGDLIEYLSQESIEVAPELDFSQIQIVYSFSSIDLKAKLSLLVNHSKGELQTINLSKFNFSNIHKSIFWTSEEKYLISKPIPLANFSANPEEVSIPLRNCFLLAGIRDIPARIKEIGDDSAEIEHLQNELGDSVTAHIKTVWPNHPIKITFLINNGLINFHVKDEGSRGKAKTADQRSDGFKQFISFLLTVSAQNLNEELKNSILLLDEPETHLHPQAQEYLLEELKKITRNSRNNIALFATHSNYMIDKVDLSRNFRIEKVDGKTVKTNLDKKSSSYSSVNYEVFGIPSTDYHNELYGRVHEQFCELDPDDTKRTQIKHFDTEYLCKEKKVSQTKPWRGASKQATLPTFVRNCIHHPNNGEKYTAGELKNSIELLKSFLTT